MELFENGRIRAAGLRKAAGLVKTRLANIMKVNEARWIVMVGIVALEEL
jgi:hypothetical protein